MVGLESIAPTGWSPISANGEKDRNGVGDTPKWIDVDLSSRKLDLHWLPQFPMCRAEKRIEPFIEGQKPRWFATTAVGNPDRWPGTEWYSWNPKFHTRYPSSTKLFIDRLSPSATWILNWICRQMTTSMHWQWFLTNLAKTGEVEFKRAFKKDDASQWLLLGPYRISEFDSE